MSRIAGFPTNNPDARKLQIRVKGKAVEVVDKETQQLMAGVSNWQVDVQSDYITGKVRHYAKIEITITDPADIFVSEEVEGSIVEGSIVDVPPIRGIILSKNSLHVFNQIESPEQRRRREALAEITHIAEDEGDYD